MPSCQTPSRAEMLHCTVANIADGGEIILALLTTLALSGLILILLAWFANEEMGDATEE